MKLTHSASEDSSSNSLIIGRTTFEACETASFFVLVNLDSLIPIKKKQLRFTKKLEEQT